MQLAMMAADSLSAWKLGDDTTAGEARDDLQTLTACAAAMNALMTRSPANAMAEVAPDGHSIPVWGAGGTASVCDHLKELLEHRANARERRVDLDAEIEAAAARLMKEFAAAAASAAAALSQRLDFVSDGMLVDVAPLVQDTSLTERATDDPGPLRPESSP